MRNALQFRDLFRIGTDEETVEFGFTQRFPLEELMIFSFNWNAYRSEQLSDQPAWTEIGQLYSSQRFLQRREVVELVWYCCSLPQISPKGQSLIGLSSQTHSVVTCGRGNF